MGHHLFSNWYNAPVRTKLKLQFNPTYMKCDQDSVYYINKFDLCILNLHFGTTKTISLLPFTKDLVNSKKALNLSGFTKAKDVPLLYASFDTEKGSYICLFLPYVDF